MKMVRMLISGACHDDSQARRAAQARHDGQRPISASGGAAFQGQEGGRDHIPSGSVLWDRRPVQSSRSCQKLERPCFFQPRLHPLVVAFIFIETMSHWAHIAHRRRCNIKPFTLSSKLFSTGQDAQPSLYRHSAFSLQ